MRNTLAVTKRILQQFAHDPRTVVLFILGPILVLWLFSVLLNSPSYQPKLALVNIPAALTQSLQAEGATTTAVSAAEARQLLSDNQVDAILTLDGTTLEVKVEGANPAHTQSVLQTVQAAVQSYTLSERDSMQSDAQSNLTNIQEQLSTLQSYLITITNAIADLPANILNALGLGGLPVNPPSLPDMSDLVSQFTPTVSDVSVSYLHGNSDWGAFDYFGPVFIGIFIFVFVFLTSGMSLVTERTGGTMERLLVTPIKSWQLVLGFCLGFGVVSLVQAALVLWACIALIGFPNAGSLLLVVLVTFSMAMVSLNLGLLVSALARSAFQIIQFMLILVVPQILLSGIFDLSAAPAWMQVLSDCFPVTHGAAALRDVMLRGAGLPSIALDLGILWLFILVFFGLACLSFSRRQSH